MGQNTLPKEGIKKIFKLSYDIFTAYENTLNAISLF